MTKTFGCRSLQRQLDVGVGLVVAQQDVEARLALFDQVVFKCQRLALVVDDDVLDIDRLAHERAGLRILKLVGFEKVAAHARAQVFRLADIDHHALGVLVQIAARLGGNGGGFWRGGPWIAASATSVERAKELRRFERICGSKVPDSFGASRCCMGVSV